MRESHHPTVIAPRSTQWHAARLVRVLAVVLLALQAIAVRPASAAPAPRGLPPGFAAFVNNDSAGPSDETDELTGMTLAGIDPNADPESVLRSRPFVVTESAFPALTAGRTLRDRTLPRDRLANFLQLRGVDGATFEQAMTRFDDRAVKVIVPDDTLRAALLMLSGWDPYQATIAAVLDGANPSGEPYGGVVFDRIGMDGAIATLYEEPGTGKHIMVFDSSYDKEPPEALIPTMVHESLHGGGGNSAEEEIVANIIDTICWAEMLSFDPGLSQLATELSSFNNFKLVALLNSSGRRGPGQLGVATSIYGDVFVGDQLADVDSESLRAAIESDWFYDALKNVGSDGQQTTAAMMARFPGGTKLGKAPRYDERMLSVIDSGVSTIVTASMATRLAALLGLQMVTGFAEGAAAGSLPKEPNDALGSRPFTPKKPEMFDPRAISLAPKRLKSDGARAALEQALAKSPADDATRAALLAKFDDETVSNLITDPSLRAATLLLGAYTPWAAVLASILDGDNSDGVPLQVKFAASRDSSPVSRLSGGADDDTAPAVLINSLYSGERIELLASIVVEGSLLHDDTTVLTEAVSAATFGTLAYADFVAADTDVARAGTWGTLQRNRLLIALLNSTGANGAVQGILAASAVGIDVLPGMYADAASFENYVDRQPWGTRFDRRSELEAPELFTTLLRGAGIEPPAGAGGMIAFSDATLAAVDETIAVYLPPVKALDVAKALALGTGR